MLRQIIHYNVTLFGDDKVSLDNLVKDSLIIYGHNRRKDVLGHYAKHYGLGEYQTKHNIDNIKRYIKSGDIVRSGLREL